MILNYLSFNENINNDLKEFDVVLVNGVHYHYVFDDINNNYRNINIEIINQTGILLSIKRDSLVVMFDNQFTPFLYNMDNFPMKRILNLYRKNVKIEVLNKFNSKKNIVLSENFRNIFSKIEIILPCVDIGIDYIDITEDEDIISYITKNRLSRLGDENRWNNKLRQKMKIGKFINMYNPRTDKINLEMKINSYKSIYNDLILKKNTFKIVTGEDIRFWYNQSNYVQGNGNLNKSCMRDERKSDRLDLYVMNPEKVALLILLNNDNKLLGRSLIWNVDEPNIVYMDRVYSVYDEIKIAFERYADEQGWNKRYSNGEDNNGKMKIFFDYNLGSPEENPYMDTFQYFNSKDMYLCNYYAYDNNFSDDIIIYTYND